jgi:Pyruvate/2-oxoacid:ferredoxin oxidoreductase delta subunit
VDLFRSVSRRESTRGFVDEARRTPGFRFFDLLHGYVYARWPYLYIGVGTGEHRLAGVIRPLVGFLSRLIPSDHREQPVSPGFAHTYHGKVLPPDAARKLVSVHEEIRLTDLEHVVPYALARDIILNNPDHIVALECPCRAARDSPCLPSDVCLVIGEPFASFVAEHHPRRARWLVPGEAEAILEAEHARGHVHHAFFKDAMLGRFYAICNCCPCCCGAMQAMRSGTPMLAASGFACVVSDEMCLACDSCSGVCPFGALTADEGRPVVDRAACMGCGVCVSACESGALSLVRAPEKGVPLDICVLMAEAAASPRGI